MEDIISNLIIELRKGTQVLIVLSQLSKKQYAYSLLQELEEQSIKIEPSTLYPLLRRLEKQGLLESNWDKTEARPRKYYELSKLGYKIYDKLVDEWDKITNEINIALKREVHHGKNN
ncbi:Transcriptional regulator, PadR family [Alteracholeplasma palmae J233]|uniref:Transcriptional regulator, PadR family n=1 Tax=Alteracholeplasma palmae (strain ATCC 49389 / J233) TaxID=1318466 RepID=U4KQL5_ALTPJ|nr:helix-turn-helix transcriptional regulator [Alteracholeplasma palmae]CCV64790.1 Transcriptional regulator, PadR family [Alteracholeplasma palmae J233]